MSEMLDLDAGPKVRHSDVAQGALARAAQEHWPAQVLALALGESPAWAGFVERVRQAEGSDRWDISAEVGATYAGRHQPGVTAVAQMVERAADSGTHSLAAIAGSAARYAGASEPDGTPRRALRSDFATAIERGARVVVARGEKRCPGTSASCGAHLAADNRSPYCSSCQQAPDAPFVAQSDKRAVKALLDAVAARWLPAAPNRRRRRLASRRSSTAG